MDLDNFNQLVGTGVNIYTSRERIRRQLIDFSQEYLELKTVDFYKTSVMSYIVDVLSILTANHLFYDSMIYREFFFVEAQLQESVYNLARWIGYEVPKATASKVDIMLTFPLTFNSPDVTFTIPNDFIAKANDIPFLVDSSGINVPSARFDYDKTKFISSSAARGVVVNNSALSVRDSDGFYRPIFVSETDGLLYASFSLSFTQHERTIEQFLIPETIQPYQFYSKKFTFDGMISGFRLWVMEPGVGEKIPLDSINSQDFNPEDQQQSNIGGRDGNWYTWNEWTESSQGIYTLSSNSQQFVLVSGINQCEIFFGNGVVGRQPIQNAAITIEMYITQGENGHVIPNSVTTGSPLSYSVTARYDSDGNTTSSDITTKSHMISYQISNPIHSHGGENTPTLPEIKRNAIVNLRSKGKLVSEMDYDDINTIMGSSFPTVEAYPLLKRSDIKVNEIMAFILLQYHDEEYLPQIVPTRNAKLNFDDLEFNENDEYTIMRTSNVMIDDESYKTLFNITLNRNSKIGSYDYILQTIKGTPTILYTQLDPSFYQQYSYIPVTGVDFDVIIDESGDSTSVYDGTHTYPVRIRVNVNHIPQDVQSDYFISDYRCKMVTKWDSNQVYNQVASYPANPNIENGEGYEWFEFEIPNYLNVPSGIQRYEFSIEADALRRNTNGRYVDEDGNILDLTDTEIDDDPDQFTAWQPLTKYYTDVMARKDLSDVMMSTISETHTWDGEYHDYLRYSLHNVPVILSSYLDELAKRADDSSSSFESTVMQTLISNLNLEDKKMLTDFINVKFPDTYGKLNNLKFNPIDHTIKSRFRTPFSWENPTGIEWSSEFYNSSSSSSSTPSIDADKYIVNGIVPSYEAIGRDLSSYLGYIAEYYEGVGWYLTKPSKGMYVRIEDEYDSVHDEKTLVYDGYNWKDVQEFSIPLIIDLKIELDANYTSSGDVMKNLIKRELIDHFSPFMGIHKNLDRSEILTVVRQIPGVQYCEVRKPEVDIRFNYDIKDLTQAQIIDYTPQYVGAVSNDRNYSSNVQDDGIQIEIVK